MPSWPNFASVALICCSFCSFSLCGCYLSDVQAPALGAFRSLTQRKALPQPRCAIRGSSRKFLGWVKENNLRVYVKERYDKAHIPKGDPIASWAGSASSNQEQPDGSKKEVKESLWGYGSGVAAATDPVYGDVVLAEYTLPFNEADVTYYRPLFRRTVIATNQFPLHVTADAAFDYWYVYETVAHRQGIAAIPLNTHGHEQVPRDPDGTPRGFAGLRMHPTFQFQHTNGFRAQRFRCPLLFPERTGESCEHAQFTKDKGCVKDPNWEKGGLMRALLDRDGPLYHAVYTQRTSAERINSQAQALLIERPKVRHQRSVENLNTLIYIMINVRALQRAQSINRGLLQMNYLRPSKLKWLWGTPSCP